MTDATTDRAAKRSGWSNVRYVLHYLDQHTASTVAMAPSECNRLAVYLRSALRIEGEPLTFDQERDGE